MARSNWEVFLALFGLQADDEADDQAGGQDDEAGEDGESEDDGWFVPSPLDLSVRSAHGGSDGERVRELARVQERAREIEEERPGH